MLYILVLVDFFTTDPHEGLQQAENVVPKELRGKCRFGAKGRRRLNGKGILQAICSSFASQNLPQLGFDVMDEMQADAFLKFPHCKFARYLQMVVGQTMVQARISGYQVDGGRGIQVPGYGLSSVMNCPFKLSFELSPRIPAQQAVVESRSRMLLHNQLLQSVHLVLLAVTVAQ